MDASRPSRPWECRQETERVLREHEAARELPDYARSKPNDHNDLHDAQRTVVASKYRSQPFSIEHDVNCHEHEQRYAPPFVGSLLHERRRHDCHERQCHRDVQCNLCCLLSFRVRIPLLSVFRKPVGDLPGHVGPA